MYMENYITMGHRLRKATFLSKVPNFKKTSGYKIMINIVIRILSISGSAVELN